MTLLSLELTIFVRGQTELLPEAQPAAEVLCHVCQARPGARVGSVSGHVLDLGVCPIGRVELAAFPVRVDRAHEVQVLRHRLPPFLGEAFGGSTGLVDVGFGVDR